MLLLFDTNSNLETNFAFEDILNMNFFI